MRLAPRRSHGRRLMRWLSSLKQPKRLRSPQRLPCLSRQLRPLQLRPQRQLRLPWLSLPQLPSLPLQRLPCPQPHSSR